MCESAEMTGYSMCLSSTMFGRLFSGPPRRVKPRRPSAERPPCVADRAASARFILPSRASHAPSPVVRGLASVEMRRLGRNGLEVPALCLGTMTFGFQVDEPNSVAILDAAFDRGLTFLDT